MSISFTDGGPKDNPPSSGGKKDDPTTKKPDPHLKSLLRRKTDLEKQIGKIQGQKVVKAFMRQVMAADPNDEPDELTNQIKPYLNKVKIQQIFPGETQLVPGKTQGNDSLYKVYVRREFVITRDHIDRIKREKGFEAFEWDSKGLVLYVWWPYQEPVGAVPEPGEVTGPGEKTAKYVRIPGKDGKPTLWYWQMPDGKLKLVDQKNEN